MASVSPPVASARRIPWWAGGILVVFGVGYLVQLSTPLRLNYDVINYLSLAASVADGTGFVAEGRGLPFPRGYPALVATLEMLGMGNPFGIVLVNLAFLGIGLAAAYAILVRTLSLSAGTGAAICGLMLASFITLKHATLPMAEAAFFGLTMGCALLLTEAHRRRGGTRWGLIAAAAAAAVAAIQIRSAGIALVPALLVATLPPIGSWRAEIARLRSNPGRALGSIVLLVGLIAATAWAVMSSAYLDEWSGYVERFGLPVHLRLSGRATLLEWGEILLNVPYDRLQAQVPAAFWPYSMAGVLGLAAVGAGVWVRRREFGPLEALIVCYTGMLAVWLSMDSRFWMPVLPIILGYCWLAARAFLRGRARALAVVYIGWFVLWGVAALAYSTHISLTSPEEFSRRYGSGSFTPAYEAALGLRDPATLGRVQRWGYEAVVRFGRADQKAAGAGTEAGDARLVPREPRVWSSRGPGPPAPRYPPVDTSGR